MLSLRKQIAKLLRHHLADRGFTPGIHPYFTRSRSGWVDVVFADALQYSKSTVTVTYGVHVPRVAEITAVLGVPRVPDLHLGQQLAGQRFYTPQPSQALESIVPAILEDLDAEAVPWFATIDSLHEVAERFRKTQGTSSFNDRGLAVYAMLLEAAGDGPGAVQSYTRTLEKLRQPMYERGHRFSRESAPGGRRISKTPFDTALVQVVEARLAAIGDAG